MKVRRSENRMCRILIKSAGPMCLMTSREESTWLWHSRLGHVNFQAMNLMSVNKMARGLPDFVQPSEICTGCLMAKQTRKSVPHQAEFHAKCVLELIHSDLCGPISPETKGGNRYFLLLVDDFSRKMWIYMLKNKNEALDAFKKFRNMVKNDSEKRIKTLRTDRGGEFVSKDFTKYCEDAGILRQYTMPYTPQQNTVVERRNRTVVQMARSFLTSMQMSCEF